MKTDTKFTQAEVSLITVLLIHNPHPPEGVYPDGWEATRDKLIQKFHRIDTRFQYERIKRASA